MIKTLLCVVLAAAGPSVQVDTLDGKRLDGTLQQIAEETVVLHSGENEVRLPFATLAALVFAPPSSETPQAGFPQAALSDGSIVVVAQCALEDGELGWPGRGAKRTIPQTAVRHVQFAAIPEALLPQWRFLCDEPRQDDFLIVVRGAVLEHHRGLVRRIAADRVHFEMDGEVLPVRRDAVAAVVFRSEDKPKTAGACCRLVETDGSAWTACELTAADGRVEWVSLAGPAFAATVDTVARIDFAQTHSTPLAELAPTASSWTPYFARANADVRSDFFAPRFNRGFYTPVPALDGKPCSDSLSLRSRSEVSWRVPEGSRRFTATVGIDDAVRPGGNAEVIVLVDDRELLRKTITGENPAEEVRVDLLGARRLTLLVDYGEGMDIGDAVVFSDARIVQ